MTDVSLQLTLVRPCVQVDVVQLEAAHELLRPFMLRRLKKEVELGMVSGA